MEEDFGVALELICFVSFIRKKVWGILNSFLSFLKKNDERKTHNILVLMLNPRFKSFCFGFYFISHDQQVTIIE